jgi:phosphoglycolate phosphatase-like HAD superfamily hydrolase
MVKLKAIIWDVDGTLAETERDGHRVLQPGLRGLGLPWRWDEATTATCCASPEAANACCTTWPGARRAALA